MAPSLPGRRVSRFHAGRKKRISFSGDVDATQADWESNFKRLNLTPDMSSATSAEQLPTCTAAFALDRRQSIARQAGCRAILESRSKPVPPDLRPAKVALPARARPNNSSLRVRY